MRLFALTAGGNSSHGMSISLQHNADDMRGELRGVPTPGARALPAAASARATRLTCDSMPWRKHKAAADLACVLSRNSPGRQFFLKHIAHSS